MAISTDHTSGLLGLEFDAAVEPFQGDLEEAEATASSCEQRAGDPGRKAGTAQRRTPTDWPVSGGPGVSGGSRAGSGWQSPALGYPLSGREAEKTWRAGTGTQVGAR